ncbi:hypothetical protein D3C80_1241500 [compost metagenome]
MAEQAHGEVGEQLDHAGLLEKGTEQDEQENVAGRYIGRSAVQPFGTKRQLVDDLVQAVATMRQVARQVFTEQSVGKEQATDDRQGTAHDPSCGLEDHDDQDQPNHHVGLGQVTRTLDQIALEPPLVQRRAQAQQAQQPGQGLVRTGLAECRVAEEHQHQQKAHVPGTLHLA